MKFFIAQKVTGENKDELIGECNKIISLLKEKGHEAYCTMIEDRNEFEKKSKKEMIKHAFNEIDDSNAMLVIVRGEGKSEGMLMEIGYILGEKKKIILLINKNVNNTYIREVADKIIEFEDIEDLYNKLNELKI